jgi:hypothetical protein
LKNFQIKPVPHPHLCKLNCEISKRGGLPCGHEKETYLAICWDGIGHSSAVNLDYAEETLRKYCSSDLDNLELVTALNMVRKYKHGILER